MPWSWIATLVADFLILREDSIARLAASHTLIKPSKLLSVYHPYVPFMLRVIVGVPVCAA
jgi:hypothetical protein